jgi:3-phosphoshikimate 1-carboxyvinyltransferase
VLLAGVHARGVSRVLEPIPSRNHTEIALREFGARIKSDDRAIEIEGGLPLRANAFTAPGDVSSAAFLIAATLAVPGSRLKISEVGLNPTRTGFISLLQSIGGKISIEGRTLRAGEVVGDLVVEASELDGADIGARWIPNVIDELPVLAVLGARTKRGVRIRDASELRAKESDRIRTVAAGLQALGAKVDEYPDGLFVPGGQTLRSGTVDSFADHRIAMAFAVAGLFSEGPVTIQSASCVDISFPGFFDVLKKISR